MSEPFDLTMGPYRIPWDVDLITDVWELKAMPI